MSATVKQIIIKNAKKDSDDNVIRKGNSIIFTAKHPTPSENVNVKEVSLADAYNN